MYNTHTRKRSRAYISLNLEATFEHSLCRIISSVGRSVGRSLRQNGRQRSPLVQCILAFRLCAHAESNTVRRHLSRPAAKRAIFKSVLKQYYRRNRFEHQNARGFAEHVDDICKRDNDDGDRARSPLSSRWGRRRHQINIPTRRFNQTAFYILPFVCLVHALYIFCITFSALVQSAAGPWA